MNRPSRAGSSAPSVVQLGLEDPKWIQNDPTYMFEDSWLAVLHVATLSSRMTRGLLYLEAGFLEKKRKLKDLLSQSSEFLKRYSVDQSKSQANPGSRREEIRDSTSGSGKSGRPVPG